MNPWYLFGWLVLAGIAAYIPWSERAVRITGLLTTLVVAVGASWLAWPSLWSAAVSASSEAQYFAGGLWAVDGLGGLFIVLVSLVSLAAALVSYRYIGHEHETGILNLHQVRFYYASLAAFTLSLLAAVLTNHLGVLWLALEGTTVSTALLVAIYGKQASYEGAWKYLLLCSLGLALGLGGIMLIAASAPGSEPLMRLSDLIAQSASLDHTLLRWGFVVALVGIGTKIGFVPLHTWLPDAHSRTPSPISAMLSGILLNVAFVELLRLRFIVDTATANSTWTGNLLLTFGLLSIALPAFLMLIQRNYKRLLAYSSIEHMGLLAFALGLGPAGAIPALMHMVGHTLAKASLFFGAGEILTVYKTTHIESIRGLGRRLPITATLWMLGIFMILALPPSALFASELILFGYGLNQHLVLTLIVIALMTVAATGMLKQTLTMVYDEPTDNHATNIPQERFNLTHGVMIVLLLLLVTCGLWFTTPQAVTMAVSLAQFVSAL